MRLITNLALILGLLGSLVSCKHASRSVNIGVDNSPPFYVFQLNGTVGGLAIEVLEEAARRRNIRIRWVPVKNVLLDEALASRKVQMWPLVGVTPERKARLFLSEPWLQSDYVLVSPKDKPVRNLREAAGLKIAYARLRLTTVLARRYLGNSQLQSAPGRTEAIQEMCLGRADAVLIESRVLDAMLLDRPEGCANLPLAISTIPGATTPLALAAVPEVAAMARELRSEIAKMAVGGELGIILDRWTPFSAEGARSIFAERAAAEKSRWLSLLAGGLLACSVLAGFIAHRSSRLRRAASAAEEEMRRAQLRFTEFMDNSPALAFIKDADGRVVYVNRSVQNIWKAPAEDWIGKTEADLWPPGLAKSMRHEDMAILSSGERRELLQEAPLPGGETGHFLTVKFRFYPEPGKAMLGGVSVDITSRFKAEEALRISEAFNRSILENTVDLIETLDCEGRLVSSNLRSQVTRSMGEMWADTWHESHAADVSKALACARDGQPMEFQATLKAETSRWFSVFVSPILDTENGAIHRILTVARDISSLRASQERLRQSEQRYRELFENNPLAAWLYEPSSLRFVDVNQTAIARYGYTRDEFLSMTIDAIRPPEDIPLLRAFLDTPVKQRKAPKQPWRHMAKDGRIFLVETTAHAVIDAAGEVRMIMVNDVTERERAATQLRNSESRYRSVVEHAGDIIYQTDSRGRFTFSNNGALRVLAWGNEVLGKPYIDLIHPLDRAAAARFYTRQLRKGTPETYYELRCISGKGQVRWLGQNVQILFGDEGRVEGFQAIARDITERRKTEEALAREAGEDSLTGLANRRTVMTKLDCMVRSQDEFCLCLCDVDSFKTVNDTYGHGSGDEVLRVFAEIIGQNVRRSDIAARLGGDEFCVAFRHTSAAETIQTIERIRQKLATAAFASSDRVFSVTATFGVAGWKAGMNLKQLMDLADNALYEGKRRGKNLVLGAPGFRPGERVSG